MEIARALILTDLSPDDRPWCGVGAGPKPLVPVATKPIIFHTMDALRSAGVLEAAVITAPSTTALYAAALGDGARWNMSLTYTQCDPVGGVRGALGALRAFTGDEPVLVQRADALMRARLRDHIVGFSRERLDALALMLAPSRGSQPPLAEAGSLLLTSDAVRIVRDQPAAGDPLTPLRRSCSHVRVIDVEGCLACHGGEASLLDANRHALDGLRSDVGGATLEDCEIQGPVVVHPTAILRTTLVRGPAIIGAGARLVDSYVGPYTSIGADTQVEGTEIEHSIVMDGARLMFVGSRLETSIVGRGAEVVRSFSMPRALRMTIGDGAHVSLS